MNRRIFFGWILFGIVAVSSHRPLVAELNTDELILRPSYVVFCVAHTRNPPSTLTFTREPMGDQEKDGYVQISLAEADRALKFLRETKFVETAFKGGIPDWPPRDQLMLRISHRGLERTAFSPPSLKSLGFLERLANRLDPDNRKPLQSYIENVKAQHYFSGRSPDIMRRWIQQKK